MNDENRSLYGVLTDTDSRPAWLKALLTRRVLVIVLALAASIDLYMLNGKYTDAVVSMSRSILHHFRVI